MISGSDIVVQTRSPNEIAEQLLALLRDEWADMVVEDASTGQMIERVVPCFNAVPQEFFAYKNLAMKELWDSEGACDANRDTMVHVLLQDRAVTVVVDDPSATVNQNVIGAVQDLAHDLFLGRQEFAA